MEQWPTIVRSRDLSYLRMNKLLFVLAKFSKYGRIKDSARLELKHERESLIFDSSFV